MVFGGKIKIHMKRNEEYGNNCLNVFSVVLGKRSDSLEARLKGKDD